MRPQCHQGGQSPNFDGNLSISNSFLNFIICFCFLAKSKPNIASCLCFVFAHHQYQRLNISWTMILTCKVKVKAPEPQDLHYRSWWAQVLCWGPHCSCSTHFSCCLPWASGGALWRMAGSLSPEPLLTASLGSSQPSHYSWLCCLPSQMKNQGPDHFLP